jgi:O-antigen/teichoic acid export membrane protein
VRARSGDRVVNTVNRNLVWLLISQLATWAMSLAVVFIVPHYLGAEEFGEFAFAVAFVGFFQLAGALGTVAYMAREIARDHTLVGPLVVNALVLKIVVATLLSAMAIGLALLLDIDAQIVALIAINCAGMYIFLTNEVLTGALSGLQRMGKMSAWATITVYVSSIGSIVVLANGGGVVALAIVVTVSGMITLIANFVFVVPLMRGHANLDLRVWKSLVVGGAPLMLLLIFNQIYSTLDIPLLAALTSTSVVGNYDLAYKWAGIPIFIATAVIGSHYPEMARLGKDEGPDFAALVNRAVKLMLLAATPAAFGLAVVAPNLIGLFYSAEFDDAARPLQILALQIPITGLDTILATALIASNKLRKYLWVAGAAAVFNPVLCALLIEFADRTWSNGATGAAIAVAITELFVMTCAIRLSAVGVMDRRTVSWSLRCTLAGAAILPVAFISTESVAALIAQVALGAILYAIAALALRVLSIELLRTIRARAIGMVSARRSRGGSDDDEPDGTIGDGSSDHDGRSLEAPVPDL